MTPLWQRWLNLAMLAGLLFGGYTVQPPQQDPSLNFLHTDGARIMDARGQPVIITGISWFGLETPNYAPHGLWARSLESFLDQVVKLGFNTLRIPFSNQLFDPASTPNGVNYDLNPELQGLNGLEILDRLVAGAGERGLKVILDRHRPDSQAQSELWYTAQYSEERWIRDWVMLAERYANDDTVIGVDLHNEPRGQATWGNDDPATDWRLAAERAGNAILAVNPNLLIIVQGVEQYQGEFYWWGGNLMGVRDYPVRLNVPGRLVYSPHTYGPGVYPQAWFSDPSFPDNMPAIWDRHWGYVQKEGIAPILLGEFGGRSVGNDQEGIWQRALVAYLQANQISYMYWTLNPNSGDTGGILLDDWQTVDPDKQALLASYQFPLIDSGVEGNAPAATGQPSPPAATQPATEAAGGPPPTAVPATPPAAQPTALAAGAAGALRVRYRTANPAERSVDVKPEFILFNRGTTPIRLEDVELVYWFQDEPGRTYLFACDWALIGCENVLGEFETAAEGRYALHLRFRPGATTLQPGQDSGEIKIRFNRQDWSELNQADDYSFAPVTEYTDWETAAVYLGGQLVWGSAPGAAPATTAAPTAASPSAATAVAGGSQATAAPAVPQPPAEAPASPAGPAAPGWALLALATFVVGFGLAWLLLRKNRSSG